MASASFREVPTPKFCNRSEVADCTTHTEGPELRISGRLRQVAHRSKSSPELPSSDTTMEVSI